MPVIVDQSTHDGRRKIVLSLNAQDTLTFPTLTSNDAINENIEVSEQILIQRNGIIEYFEAGYITKYLRVYATGVESHYSSHYILDDYYRLENVINENFKSKIIKFLNLKTNTISRVVTGAFFKTDRIESILGTGVVGVNLFYDIDFNISMIIRYD